MDFILRKATINDLPSIWDIIQKAIIRRKKEGSNQWQDNYPNPKVLKNDLDQKQGHVLTNNTNILGYCSIGINNEPEYNKIEGKWLTNNDYIVIHRLAICEKYLGKGIAKTILSQIEELALKKNIKSIKADTNADNFSMLHLLNKFEYTYCGIIYYSGSARQAFEKVLNN